MFGQDISRKFTFTKEDTLVMKAVAIALMLIHHLAYKDRICDNLDVISLTYFDGIDSAFYIGRFGKICVSLFMFLGGIGIYRSFQKGKLDIFNRIRKLYISYWKVFVIFIPLGFLMFGQQSDYCVETVICHVFEKFDAIELIKNFLGIDATYCGEWWFLLDYVVVLLTFWMLNDRGGVHTFGKIVLLIILYNIFLEAIVPAFARVELLKDLGNSYLFQIFIKQKAPYVSCFWMGCACAKDNILEKLREKLYAKRMLNVFSDAVGVVLVVVIRNSILGHSVDMFLVIALTIFVTDFVKRLRVNRLFIAIGKKSTNMWLIHPFFCYYFYLIARLVYSVQYAIFMWTLLMALTYAASMLVDGLYANMEKMLIKVKGVMSTERGL